MENMEKELEEIKAIEERELKELELMNENENREFYVYAHIRLDKMETFYIGKGKGERAYDLERNFHHDNISNMYGHAVLIIKDNLTEEEAFELERDTIEDYVFNLGYGIDIEGHKDYDHELPHLTNMTWGGEGTSGAHHTEETKEKISESSKGKKMSDEAKRKMSESRKGIEHSEETKQKISEKMKGKLAGEKHPMYGKHHTEETKEKMSEKMKGKNNPMYGKGKKVICITTGETFNSIKDAEKNYNVGGISKCCRGKYKHAGKLQDGTKLQWKYSENDDN